jgi:hypothetical protein
MTTSIVRPPVTAIKVTAFRRYSKNTLEAFVDLEFVGLCIGDCSLHRKGEERWVSMPGQQIKQSDGSLKWVALLSFSTKDSRQRFQAQSLEAIDRYLAEEALSESL